jgi:hypothetical protein
VYQNQNLIGNAIASTGSNVFTISSTTCNLSTAPQTPQSIPSANDDISFNVSQNLKKKKYFRIIYRLSTIIAKSISGC